MWNASLRNAAKATIFFLCLSFITVLDAQPVIGFQPFISSGISQPIEVVTAPNDATGRLFIVGKDGVIRIWNGTTVLSTPFLDISGIVADDGEHGLLSMAFHPQYASNGFFFVYYNNNVGNVVVARYQVSGNPNVANPTANPVTPLVDIPKPFDNHNGGHLQFKVESGINWLYFATGDGGSGDDPNRNSQNQSSLLGKMLRLNVDAPTPTPQIWAWGLRNPFRWSFDRATGDMWIGDVGQGLKEEVDFRPGATSGANYGWPCFEALVSNPSGQSGSRCDTVDLVDVLPIFNYDNPVSGSSSVIGGYVYRGTEFPSLQGYYITVDFYSGQLWLINGSSFTITTQNGLPTNIASISESNDGSTLYAISLSNIIYKITVAIATPVTLVSFSGKPFSQYNQLKWVTAAERDISKFIIEYSTNGLDYQPAGELLAGYANGGTYVFNHHFTNNTNTFYRLKILEANSRFTYSPVISLGRASSSPILVYPTVVTNGMLNVVSEKPVEQLDFYNTDGLRVFTRDMNGITGFSTISFPALPKGIYVLKLSGQNFQETKKIIIQ